MIKKLLFLCVYILTLLSPLKAAPIATSISMDQVSVTEEGYPTAKKVNISYVFDYVFKRDLENNSGEIDRFIGNFIRMAYPLMENTSFYLMLGMIQYEVQEHEPITRSYETNQDFAFGGGFLFHLFETARNMSIDADFKFRRADNNINYMTSAGSGGVTYEDWQVSLIVSRPHEIVTPYIGIKYSDVNIDSISPFSKQSANYPLGSVVGIRLDDGQEVFFSIEARFIDEFAMSMQLGYQF